MANGESTGDRQACGCILHSYCGRYGCLKKKEQAAERDAQKLAFAKTNKP